MADFFMLILTDTNQPFMKYLYSLLIASFFYSQLIFSQAGSLDPSFAPTLAIDEVATAVTTLPDGNILLAVWSTTSLNSTLRKLSPTGTIISGFSSGVFGSGYITSILVQEDGKIIVAGDFESYNSSTRKHHIVRLNTSGGLDSSFNFSVTYMLSLTVIKKQPGVNKMLVGGVVVDYSNDKPLIRINLSDGSIDTTFNSGGSMTNGQLFNNIYSIDTYPNGEILIGGDFHSYNGQRRIRLAKLNADGSLDGVLANNGLNFSDGDNGFGLINSILIQDNNNFIVAGNISYGTGTSQRKSIAKFTGNSINTAFNATELNNIWGIANIKAQPNGQIIVSGEFTAISGVSKIDIARLDPLTGAVDPCFDPGSSTDGGDLSLSYGSTGSIAIDPIGNIYTVGHFSSYNGTPRQGIAKIFGNNNNTITANNDNGSTVQSGTQITAIASVLTNDTFNGVIATTANVTISAVLPLTTGINLNTSTGAVTVNAGTAPSTYVQEYQICQQGTTCNCTIATATVTVSAPTPIVSAVNNIFTVNRGCPVSTILMNVLDNDTYTAPPAAQVQASTSNVTISAVGSVPSALAFNTATGVISIPSATIAGTYYFRYRITSITNPTIFSEADVAITVVNPPAIVVVNDQFSAASGVNTLIATSIFSNDTYGGSAATSSNVTLTTTNTNPNIQVNTATGKITVTSSVTPGTYTFNYTICSNTNLCNCTTGTVTIIVGNAVLNAVTDNFTIYSCLATTLNVLANDTYNGAPATTSNVTITFVNYLPFITTNSNGTIYISSAVQPGTWGLFYKITDNNNAANYRTGQVHIKVLGPVIAVNDVVTANFGTASTVNLVANDYYGCNLITSDTNPSISSTSTLPTGISVDLNNSTVTVSSTIAPGNYNFTYTICDPFANNECDTATVTVNVGTPPITPGIRANSIVTNSGIFSSGKILIMGYFIAYNNLPVNHIALLSNALTLDQNFNSSGAIPLTSRPLDFKIQSDDKIVVVGGFTGFSGEATGTGVTRLLPSGQKDPLFNSGTGVAGLTALVYTTTIQSDGKILIGGNFVSFNGYSRKSLARLTPTGGIDPSFNVGIGFNGEITSILEQQSDHHLIVAGAFNSYQGSTYNSIIKLKDNGDIDPSFITGTGITEGSGTTDSGTIWATLLLPNGDIMLAGNFNKYNGTLRQNIVKLHSNGSLDTAFNLSGLGFDGVVRTLMYDSDSGKIFVGGEFTTYKGVAVKKIVRIDSVSGNLDSSFSSGTGPAGNGNVWTMTRQNDGKVILGGQFTSYNGISATNVTRIAPSIPGNQSRTNSVYWESEPEIDIRSSLNKSITIYPNPSVGTFNIDLSGYNNERFDVTIHNTLGQLMYTGSISSETSNQINLNNAQSGNYFIRLQNNNETIFKIITVK